MKKIILSILIASTIYAGEVYGTFNTKLPDLKMPDTQLSFDLIKGYQDYKIIATHYRTDKKELRYILANPIGYNALKAKQAVMPEGSIIVKIGWSVKKMPRFPTALEVDTLQRVEYMIKDSKRFNANGDHWGYARFVKNKGSYKSWDKGIKGCINCHSSVKDTDYLFTKMQESF